MTVSEIVETLVEAKAAYYENSTPIMSDAEFDSLEDELRTIDPSNSYFAQVGTLSKDTNKKITHPIPMLSMQKGKIPADIFKWQEKLNLPTETQFCIQPKIDGLSASCCYENGKLLYVATRGDGIIGQDISHVADYIDDIPQTIHLNSDRLEIRGELYLPKNTKYDTGGRPLRNNCVGLINRKDNYTELHHVRFAAFQVSGLNDITNESEIIALLAKENFHTVSTKTIHTQNELENYYDLYLDTLRSQWNYETDGLVVCVDERALFEEIDSRWIVDHHHHYAIALKPPSESKGTTLKHIEWQISRQGNAIPVAVFEPVIIGGARIERASLSNYETIKKMNICDNDSLLIERANDVIPYVRANVSEQSRKTESRHIMITNCPSCETALIEKAVHLHCPNKACPETNIQKILYWVKESKVEQVAEASIRTLYNLKLIKSISDLYTLQEEDFTNVEGFADKKTKSFISEIKKSRSMKARDFIAKLGIPLVQKKALSKLAIFSMEDFYNFNDITFIIGQNIISWRDDTANMELLTELVEILDIQPEEQDLSKKKVCMTGKGPMGRNELIKIIEEKGYEFVKTITSETDILICEDPEGSSSKLTKARKNGTEITSYDLFFNS